MRPYVVVLRSIMWLDGNSPLKGLGIIVSASGSWFTDCSPEAKEYYHFMFHISSLVNTEISWTANYAVTIQDN